MKLHQSQLSTIKFHIYPCHPSECWSSMFSQHFHYNIKPKLRAFGKLRELESFIKTNVWKGSMGDLSKYKNLNKKNERVLRARKEVRTMAGWSYSISQEIIYSCFFSDSLQSQGCCSFESQTYYCSREIWCPPFLFHWGKLSGILKMEVKKNCLHYQSAIVLALGFLLKHAIRPGIKYLLWNI